MQGGQGNLNSAVPNWKRIRTVATSAGFTSTSMTCNGAVHRMRS